VFLGLAQQKRSWFILKKVPIYCIIISKKNIHKMTHSGSKIRVVIELYARCNIPNLKKFRCNGPSRTGVPNSDSLESHRKRHSFGSRWALRSFSQSRYGKHRLRPNEPRRGGMVGSERGRCEISQMGQHFTSQRSASSASWVLAMTRVPIQKLLAVRFQTYSTHRYTRMTGTFDGNRVPCLPLERVFTETGAFPDKGTFTFFDRLNEFSLSFQFFFTLNFKHPVFVLK